MPMVAWLLAALGLYGGFVALELYWNLLDWQPRLDGLAGLVLVWTAAMVAAIWRLARRVNTRPVRIVSFLLCVALAALGVYLLPKEALQPGPFGRDLASPTWYRGVRLVLLWLPLVFWRMGAPPCGPRGGKGAPAQ